jgi:hypothetical protein
VAGISQRSFAGGERAEDLWNATDAPGYSVSARRMRNFFPIAHGAAVNRPGSALVSDRAGKDASQAAWLIHFVFSEAEGQAYAIELGHQYARFISNVTGAYVAPDPAQYAAWDVATTYAAGVWVSAGGVAYRSLQAGNTGHDPAGSPTWWSTPAVYEITTPYAHGDLAAIQFAQVGDVVTLVRHGYVEAELRRYAHARWTHTSLSFDVPVSSVWTAGVAAVVNPYYAPDGTHIGRPWRHLVTTVERDQETGLLSETAPHEVTDYQADMAVHNTGILPELRCATADRPFWVRMHEVNDGLAVPFVIPATVVSFIAYRGQGKDFGRVAQCDPVYGLVGGVRSLSGFKLWDDGATPDYTRGPPRGTNPFKIFDETGLLVRTDQAACVAFFQRRRVFGNLGSAATPYRPHTIVASAIENFANFDVHTLPAAEDSVEIRISSRFSGEVRWLLDTHVLLVGTSAGVFAATGKSSTALVADEVPVVVNQNEEGAAALHPIRVADDVLYVGERADSVIALQYDDVRRKYLGTPIEEFSDHLVRRHRIVDWAYQKKPYSVVWAVREDGKLLSLTYRPSMKAAGWAWHELADGGAAESVCCIPQGAEDAVYLVVRRTVGGATKRYIERLTSRQVNDARLGVFLDSSLTYDGRNTSATTVTVSEIAGGGYGPEASVAVASSADVFVAGDVGNDVILDPDAAARYDANGDLLPSLGPVRLRITAYTGPRAVTAEVISPAVPAELQATATTAWARAVDELSGLGHLEGKTVLAVADGSVVRADAAGAALVVAGGSVTLADRAAVIHVGLGYDAELEMLDLAAGGDGKGKEKIVKQVFIDLVKSLGAELFAGPSLEDADLRPWEIQAKNVTEVGEGPVKLLTGLAEIPVPGEWTKHGRCAVKQADPLPCTVVAVTRDVEVR